MQFIFDNLKSVLGSIVLAFVALLIPMAIVKVALGIAITLGEFQLITLLVAVPFGIALAKYLTKK